MYRNLRSLIFVFAIVLIGTSCQNEQVTQTEQNTTEETISENTIPEINLPTVTPPLENIDVTYQKFAVNASEAKVLEMENGSSIEIPANAFVDKNGNPVTGKVDIQYREFHNAGEILASGIPMMAKDADGEEAYMQTAGMFEIKGFANGELVQLAENKELMVNMASHVEGDYDFWSLDEESGEWINKGTNTPKVNQKKAAAKNALAQLTGNKKEAKKPVKPVAFNKAKPALNFDINYKEFPELKKMKGVVWQYAGSDARLDPAQNKWIFKEEWDFVTLENSTKEGQYEMVLTNKEKTYKVPVFPSRRAKDFEKAMASYNEELKSYKKFANNREAQLGLYKKQAEFVRSFAVNGMGIHNYDILVKDKNNIPLLANFDFGNDVPSNMRKMIPVYLITADGRSVVAFPYENWDRVIINPNSDNRLIAVLPGNKLAVFSQRDFDTNLHKMEAARKKEYTFKMRVLDKKVESVAAINEVISTIS